MLTYDFLKGAQRTIEEEFTKKWLSNKVRACTRSNVWPHPIPKQWNACQELLDGRSRPRTPAAHLELHAYLKFAHDLASVRGLPNYASCIPSRLKHPEFFKAQYEIHIAALSVHAGHTTSFVVPSSMKGERTPDLMLHTTEEPVYVECKRKDPFVAAAETEPEWRDLEDRLDLLLNEFGGGYQVVVLAFGGLDSDANEILEHVRAKLVASSFGVSASKNLSCAIILTRFVLPIGPRGQLMGLPRWGRDSVVQGTVSIDAAGNHRIENPTRSIYYRLDSHRLRSILASFDAARGQVPHVGRGLIYIDADVTRLSDPDFANYFELLGLALRHCFSPAVNSRIDAILLSGGPMMRRDGVSAHRVYKTIANPFSRAPLSYVIPGGTAHLGG